MKKKIIFLVCFLLIASAGFTESLKGGIGKNDYSDYLETVNLTAKQREQILKIRNEENYVLRPLVLEIHSKERGLEFLSNLRCDFFDSDCKKRLKEDIELREFEKNELLRKINQKKNYYRIRYRNILTREQDIQIQKMIEENEHKDKVLAERAERQRKQERIDKLKVWEKFKKK